MELERNLACAFWQIQMLAPHREEDMSLSINVVRCQKAAAQSMGVGEQMVVSFEVRNNPHTEIEIWVPRNNFDEADHIQVARAYLHNFAKSLVEATQKWALTGEALDELQRSTGAKSR